MLHSLTTPSDTVQEDSANTMWSTYMKEVLEYDKFMADGWREDAKGFLVFVSPSVHWSSADIVPITLKDRSILCDRFLLFHRRL
jgi:hypothetical protein